MSDREWTRREGRLAYALCLSSWHAYAMSEWPCDYHLGRARDALKLMGEPESLFTWDDVEVLREAADDPEMWSGRDKDADLRDLAERIAATLPPKDPR